MGVPADTVVVEITRALASEERGAPVPLPEAMTAGAAGSDLRADESFDLAPMERRLVPTGVCVAIPMGYEGQVRPRSGLAVKHGVTVINSPGTVDSDYRGELKVGLVNLGAETFHVERGDRIAQIVIAPVCPVQWRQVESLSSTDRGEGGFGSTGR